MTLPFRNPLGGLACSAARRPRLDLSLFPPSPLPPFPSGEGGDFLVFLCKGLRPLHPPGLNPGGTYSPCRRCCPAGGACPCLFCFACHIIAFPPIPPASFPSGEGGDFWFISPGATAPGTPALNRLRHLQSLPNRFPAGEGKTHGSAYNQQEGFPSEQCRQPRRGGTGGDGTIRRKRRRRLRWSSPPGQG